MASRQEKSGSGDDSETSSNSNSGRSKQYHRHSNQQIEQLEAFFKDCPHPDEQQRRQLSRDLGLEPRQVKFWFQNRRTQAKVQGERADNSSLRQENEKILCENVAMREALKNVICPNCNVGGFSDEDRALAVQNLRLENAKKQNF